MQHDGIVVMLDVLGWQKGKSILEPDWRLITYASLLSMNDMRKNYKRFANMRFVGFTIATDRDNLVVAAWQPSEQIDAILIEYVSAWVNSFFGACWQRKLPIRGSMSCGKFTTSEDYHSLSGPALADAKSEYNAMNWVGCHATSKSTEPLGGIIPKYKTLTNTFVGLGDPPYKDKSLTGVRWVINWPFAYYKQTDEKDIREIMADELKQVEDEKDRKKYEITMRYFDKVFEEFAKRDQRRAKRT